MRTCRARPVPDILMVAGAYRIGPVDLFVAATTLGWLRGTVVEVGL